MGKCEKKYQSRKGFWTVLLFGNGEMGREILAIQRVVDCDTLWQRLNGKRNISLSKGLEIDTHWQRRNRKINISQLRVCTMKLFGKGDMQKEISATKGGLASGAPGKITSCF